MIELENSARARLEKGELALGIGLRQARTVDIAKAMKTCGYDWLFIDMEHNSMSLDTAVQISVAAQDAGICPIVRVPGFQHFHATRVLDGGALGIVVPHVDTVEQAKAMVAQCKYPPVGHRSVTGALPQLEFATHPMADATKAINNAMLLVLMIETPLAVENAAAIAAVEGVDALLVGTNDLCMEMGIPGELDNPQVVEALQHVVDACKTNDKYPGLGGVYAPELMALYINMGMRFILCGNDLSMMMAAAKQQAHGLRKLSL